MARRPLVPAAIARAASHRATIPDEDRSRKTIDADQEPGTKSMAATEGVGFDKCRLKPTFPVGPSTGQLAGSRTTRVSTTVEATGTRLRVEVLSLGGSAREQRKREAPLAAPSNRGSQSRFWD